MNNIESLNLETQCVHAGVQENPEGAVVTPIYQTSTFKFDDSDQGAALFKGEREGYIYSRMRNPTVEALEDAVAVLEGGAKALGCASGMAAVNLLFTATLSAGDHIICSESVYGPTATILKTVYERYNVEYDFVDTSDLDAVRAVVKDNTKLIYVETPGNPTLVIADIEEIAKIAHENGAKMAVDNTFMSPILQKPFALGADYILHSMTKYLNGHADVIAGILIVKDEAEYPHFRKTLNHLGGVIDPFNSFLVHRGLKTLNLRVMKQCENARKVAEWLEKQPEVEHVFFPGLESHPQYNIGKKQMKACGSMISFELKGGIEAGKKMMDNVEICQLAVSLGGVESLIQHPASMTHAGMGPEDRKKAKITDGLVRLSVGIENVEDLIAGLEKGLKKI